LNILCNIPFKEHLQISEFMSPSPKKVSHHPCYGITHTEAACSFSVLIEELICSRGADYECLPVY